MINTFIDALFSRLESSNENLSSDNYSYHEFEHTLIMVNYH